MNCLQNSEEYNHELKYIITLDGGTTNTRAYLWRQDGSFVSSKKERAGVRNTAMDGSDQVIRETVKRCIDSLIEESHIEESQVQGIFCSGMLTSNVGLEEIPYLCAPVDERALCNAIECRFFSDITRIPFYMIPGVRNHVEKDRILEEKLIVILRGLAEEKLIATVDILKNMGMHFFELAIDNESELSMEKSLRNIEGLRKHYGDSIHIGAGTVINKLQVKRVAEIGGEYIISPNLNEEVVRATKEMGLVSIPGAATPSEIIRAYQEGADIVKVFPANYLGEAYIRAIKAPLDYIPIAAVGGIRPEDIPAFQSAGVSCFGVGKQLVDAGLFSSYCDEEVFQIIEDRAKRYLQAIR